MGTTTNGLVVPELGDAANVPGDILGLGVSVDARYGLTVAAFSNLAGIATPFPGMTVWVTADLAAYVYNGTAWVPTSGEQWVYTKTAISTPLNSTTLSNVPGWSWNLVEGMNAIDLDLVLLNPGSSGVDMKFGFTWTATGALTWGFMGPAVGINAPAYSGDTTFLALSDDTSSPADTSAGVGTPAGIPVRANLAGTFECTAPGVLQLQFAQFVADVNYDGQITHGSRGRVKRIGA